MNPYKKKHSDYCKRKRTRTASDHTHPKPGSVQNVILVNYCVTDPQPITHRNTDWAAASLSQAPVSLFHVLSPGISSNAQLVIILNINELNLHWLWTVLIFQFQCSWWWSAGGVTYSTPAPGILLVDHLWLLRNVFYWQSKHKLSTILRHSSTSRNKNCGQKSHWHKHSCQWTVV